MSVHEMTMGGLCRRMALAVPARLAFVDGTARITFAQFHARTNQLAHALAKAGVGRGDRVAALLLNGLPLVELYFATAKLGAILLPLNWRLVPSEVAYILKNGSPRILFVSDSFVDAAEKTGITVPKVTVPGTDAHTSGEYANFLADGSPGELAEVAAADDPWVLIYTSGTTGRPKGCLITHRAKYVCNLALVAGLRLTEEERFLFYIPLFHVGGLGIVAATFAAGGSTVLLPKAPETEAILRTLVDEECTSVSAPSPLLKKLVDAQASLRLPLRLRWVMGIGGLELPETVRAVGEVLGADFVGGYGQSECGNFIALVRLEDQLARPTSCGRILPHLDFQVVDEAGHPVPPGAIGELCLRGPSIMQGYWDEPTATAEAFRSGWMHTGDMVRLDGDGYLYIVDRMKDLVKTGGENVYPKEVELRLLEHPAVADCAVVGVPDATWGEAVKAVLVLQPGAFLTAADVAQWCREGLAGYKRPRYVEFVSVIPRNPTGKVEKAALRSRPTSPDQATGGV